MPTFEIEVKSLLGAEISAFKQSLLALNPQPTGASKQLNHYFTGGNLSRLYEVLGEYFDGDERERFRHIVEVARDASVRTRLQNETVLLVIKASVDATTSANGITRIEFESAVPLPTIDALDEKILSAGYEYQAKWSREREEYRLEDVNICVDKNAGYGYLAEFEIMVEQVDEADAARARIDALMMRLGAEELPQDRLERMFSHYNANWREYYGTDRTFTIE